ncbi:MAG: efflux RND transporter periplasmic adaptor subunit [Pseudolabrys sp.]|nr:efflux RND transporter periplasmic adaptor subunit [Pseudolabrys sp.]MBV9954408.1 efflux RND transporter periplasmic adaptor subunit [Pseudolabrys sp.]
MVLVRWAFAVALGFALAACGSNSDRPLQGWVEANLVFVSPDEAGRIEDLAVREGDRVSAGAALFTVDNDLQKADLAIKQAALVTAQQAFDRARELVRAAAGTQKALDDAQAGLAQAQANLEWAQTRLARRRGASPAAGVIQQIYFRPGETVPAGRPVVSLLPPQNLKIRFFAPEAFLPRVKIGQSVNVSCDGCEKNLTAKVSFIAGTAEFTPPVIYSLEERSKLVFLIEARPDDPEKFRVGQPVSVVVPDATK